jgi:hypothetical protein
MMQMHEIEQVATQKERRGPLVRRIGARFRRLSRAKRLLLVLLGGLDLILAFATTIYAFTPAAVSQVPSASAYSQATSVPLDAGMPMVAGNFIQLGKSTQAELALRQYDGAITGTYTVVTCAGSQAHTEQRIITGEALGNDTLRLTFSAPDLPHSLTVVYQFALQTEGFELRWHDQTGRTQAQRWLPEETPPVPLACG